MNVNGTASSSGTQSTSSQSLLGSGDSTQTFMTMLVAELQNQDPSSPMDPSEMVDQLVQLNSLNELMAMHQDLDTLVNGTTAS